MTTPASTGGRKVGDPGFLRTAKPVIDWHDNEAVAHAAFRVDQYLEAWSPDS
jgi:hypothetical protein